MFFARNRSRTRFTRRGEWRKLRAKPEWRRRSRWGIRPPKRRGFCVNGFGTARLGQGEKFTIGRAARIGRRGLSGPRRRSQSRKGSIGICGWGQRRNARSTRHICRLFGADGEILAAGLWEIWARIVTTRFSEY